MRHLMILMMVLTFAFAAVSSTAFAKITAEDQSTVFDGDKKKKKGAGDAEPECD
jgi:hypothetical protein